MKINCNKENIEEVRRLGKKQEGGKIRPIVVSFNTIGIKIKLLKNKRELNETPYYIKEDFPPEVLEERKKLSAQLLEERNKGRKAFINYNKLVIIPETTQKQYNNKNRNSSKRQLSESPETHYNKPGPSNNNNAKKPHHKKQNSNIDQFMMKTQNKNTKTPASTLSPPTISISTEPSTPHHPTVMKKY
ncbi:hypothetical protein ACJJTC_010017 [Scirpophaga incertulas]